MTLIKKLTPVLVAVVALSIQGCGGGGGSSSICQPIGSSGQVSAPSAGVEVDQPANAFDGNLGSAAELYSISGSGNADFEAQGGASSAGFAGILLGLPSGQVTQVNITTRRNGATVTSGTAGTHSNGSATACPGICVQEGNVIYMGIEATGTFDEIVATVQISGTTEDTLVYELCTKNL